MVGISGREDVLVDVYLVGYDEAEAAEKGGHGAGVGAAQEPGVDHVGGHDDHGSGGQELLSLADGDVSGDLFDAVGGEFGNGCGLLPAE